MRAISTVFALAIVSYAGVSLGCSTDEHADSAEIHFIAPLDGSTVAPGADVPIEIHVTADAPMHGWVVTVRNTADSAELATFDDHDHADTYEIAEIWTANVESGTEVEIEIAVTLDHDSDPITSSATITVE